jgi:hypothetical protein
MSKVIEFLKGKKTNIVGVGIGIVAALFATDVIDQPTAEFALTVLGGGALMTLRDAIKSK